jgi:hypothetical protein
VAPRPSVGFVHAQASPTATSPVTTGTSSTTSRLRLSSRQDSARSSLSFAAVTSDQPQVSLSPGMVTNDMPSTCATAFGNGAGRPSSVRNCREWKANPCSSRSSLGRRAPMAQSMR